MTPTETQHARTTVKAFILSLGRRGHKRFANSWGRSERSLYYKLAGKVPMTQDNIDSWEATMKRLEGEAMREANELSTKET